MFLTILTVGCFYKPHHKHAVSVGEGHDPLDLPLSGVLYRFKGILWSVGMTCLGMLLDFKIWVVLCNILFMFTCILYFPKN